jgi:hypothetical protein
MIDHAQELGRLLWIAGGSWYWYSVLLCVYVLVVVLLCLPLQSDVIKLFEENDEKDVK